MRSDLDKSLLYAIMRRMGELRSEFPNLTTTIDLFDLVKNNEELGGEEQAFFYLDRHVRFLGDLNYLVLGRPTMQTGDRVINLTAQGQMFVQPELAEFGHESLLPEIIKTLERKIQVLTYPEVEKNGLLFKIREAVATQTPELIMKAFIEVGSRVLGK
jgi:hypothetical protein